MKVMITPEYIIILVYINFNYLQKYILEINKLYIIKVTNLQRVFHEVMFASHLNLLENIDVGRIICSVYCTAGRYLCCTERSKYLENRAPKKKSLTLLYSEALLSRCQGSLILTIVKKTKRFLQLILPQKYR